MRLCRRSSWTLKPKIATDTKRKISTPEMNSTSPLGDRWLVMVFTNKLPLYTLSRAFDPTGLSLSRVYIISPNLEKRPARALKNKGVIKGSCFPLLISEVLHKNTVREPCGSRLIDFGWSALFFNFCSSARCWPPPAIAAAAIMTTSADTAPKKTICLIVFGPLI